jgi:hypothetical protein
VAALDVDPIVVRHPELLIAICAAIAVEFSHLRWIVLNRWTCRGCGETHLHCDCKPVWVKLLF